MEMFGPCHIIHIIASNMILNFKCSQFKERSKDLEMEMF